jgi:type VI protein secretion system component Hcp
MMHGNLRKLSRRTAVLSVAALVVASAIVGHSLSSRAAASPVAATAGASPIPPAASGSGHATAGDPAFLSLNGIVGESTAVKYANWIDVTSWRWAASSEGSGTPSINNASVTFSLNRAIPPIVARLLSSERIASAVLAFVKNADTRTPPYLQVKFTDVLVTGWNEAWAGQAPVEELAFTFRRVSYIYTYQSPTGMSRQYQFCWDQVARTSSC